MYRNDYNHRHHHHYHEFHDRRCDYNCHRSCYDQFDPACCNYLYGFNFIDDVTTLILVLLLLPVLFDSSCL